MLTHLLLWAGMPVCRVVLVCVGYTHLLCVWVCVLAYVLIYDVCAHLFLYIGVHRCIHVYMCREPYILMYIQVRACSLMCWCSSTHLLSWEQNGMLHFSQDPQERSCSGSWQG